MKSIVSITLKPMPKKLYIDLETTGLDPQMNGIIQIAGIIEPGEEVMPVEFDFDVRPFREDLISDEALAVSGKTLMQVMNYPEAKGVHKQLTTLLGKYVDRYDASDKFLLCGYNAGFDASFLRAWMTKCGNKYYGSYFLVPPIDIMTIAGWVLAEERHEMENFKLATVAKYLKLTVPEDMHNAMTDIRLTREVEEALVERLMKTMVMV